MLWKRFFGAPTNFWSTIDHLLHFFLFEYGQYPKSTKVEIVPMEGFSEIVLMVLIWENVFTEKEASYKYKKKCRTTSWFILMFSGVKFTLKIQQPRQYFLLMVLRCTIGTNRKRYSSYFSILRRSPDVKFSEKRRFLA